MAFVTPQVSFGSGEKRIWKKFRFWVWVIKLMIVNYGKQEEQQSGLVKVAVQFFFIKKVPFFSNLDHAVCEASKLK